MVSTANTVQWCQAAQAQLSSSEHQEETNEDIINNLTQLEYLTEKENVKSGKFYYIVDFTLIV